MNNMYGVEFAGDAASSALFIYPAGLDKCAGQSGWDASDGSEDFIFFDDLIAWARQNFCIDETRIFAFGHSNGGYMANALGCQRGDVFRAVASLAGGPPDTWNCKGDVAMLGVDGGSDTIVEPSEGKAAHDHFLSANACSVPPDARHRSRDMARSSGHIAPPLGLCGAN